MKKPAHNLNTLRRLWISIQLAQVVRKLRLHWGSYRCVTGRRARMKKEGRAIYSILLGVVVIVLGFSENLAVAQTTSSISITREDISVTTDSTDLARRRPIRPIQPIRPIRPIRIDPPACGRIGGRCASVPEPASVILLGAGLAGLGIWKRASRKT